MIYVLSSAFLRPTVVLNRGRPCATSARGGWPVGLRDRTVSVPSNFIDKLFREEDNSYSLSTLPCSIYCVRRSRSAVPI